MKKFGLILLIISLLVSCKDETTYRMEIIIKNETNSLMTVKMFPKSDYMYGNLYDFSEIGSGYRETEFQLEISSEQELYISSDLNKKPNVLAAEIFDSIYVISSDENRKEIIFSPGKVIGYSENLYDNDSLWSYKLRNFDLPTSFQRNPVESHNYIFTISEDKYSL